MKRTISLFLLLLTLCASAFAQDAPKVQWTGEIYPKDVRAGESAQLLLTAKVVDGWHIYAMDNKEGPQSTTFELKANPSVTSEGKAIQPKPYTKYDEGFEFDIQAFAGAATFAVPVKIAKNSTGKLNAIVSVRFQACDESRCENPRTEEVKISFDVAGGEARPELLAAVTKIPEQPSEYKATEDKMAVEAAAEEIPKSGGSVNDTEKEIAKARDSGLGAYLWLAFVSGLLALLTPCVWPMIPITVSFFSKSTGDTKKIEYKGAVAYCLGIIGTFTALGLIMTALFGSAGINRLAQNPWVNLVIALVFIVLAANLFGLFEIVMPSSMVNKASTASRKGGLLGPVLMGLTFSLTTFTCTVPFVGTILVAAASGDYLYPTLGMLAFSSAFALPFMLLAIFPQTLARMPKSGAWLANVKIVMGFLELAAALKFLSNANLAKQLGWITREVFIAIWAMIAAFAGLYLIGAIFLGHQEREGKIGFVRRIVGVAFFAIAVYCLAGLRGNSLGELAAFLPPDPYPGRTSSTAQAIPWTHKYDEGVAKARSEGKLLFINFTGVQCTNCRWMESNMFPRPGVAKRVNSFVPIELYTDRETPEDQANQKLLQKMTNSVLLPAYVIATPDGEVIAQYPGLTRNEGEFTAFLDKPNGTADVVARNR